MKVVIDPGEQLKFKPFKPEIIEELQLREGNKDYVYNLTPFVRVSCLQEVAYTNEDLGKKNNLKDVSTSVLVDETEFNGFQFIFNSDFEESYGEIQKIGKTLDNREIRIKNPRRVPPPSLTSFTATVGENSDYFTTAQLNFTCNSLEQFQFLVPFLFNPGNTIFVEFGHNTDKLKQQISFFDADDAKKLVESSVIKFDCNQAEITEGFVEELNKRVFESGGAYEYFYGMINDVDFTMNESLGYDCTVDLIAISKMKLKAPNTDDYSSISDARSVSLTLDSKLKTFKDILYTENDFIKRNRGINKDIIFSFDDRDSATYVRLKNILRFLGGDYSKLTTNFISDFYERFNPNREIPYSLEKNEQLLINGQLKGYDTVIGKEAFIGVKKPNLNNNQPPAVSYNSDVLLFREKMWSPTIDYSKDYGGYSIVSGSEDNYLNGTSLLSNRTLEAQSVSSQANTSARSGQGVGAIRQTQVGNIVERVTIKTTFEKINPFLMDKPNEGFIWNDDYENLANAYINFDVFSRIYKNSEGKVLDVLKKLGDLINSATNDIWDVTFVGEAYQPQIENNCPRTSTTFISLNSSELENGNTYTFKADSKGSIFSGLDYGLGLDGLLGDQIYMNSLNSSDGSAESQKLNLLLFSNHENNLQIIDKRNQKIRKLRESEPTTEPNPTAGSDDNEINKRSISADVKKSFFGRELILNTGNGEINKLSPDSVFAQEISDRLSQGDDPSSTPIQNLKGFSLDYNRGTPINDQLSREEVNTALDHYYNLEIVPLVYTPIKSLVERLRGKDRNIQPNSEEKQSSNNGINPLLESTLDITMPGIGGINPLEYSKVSGIPDVYAKRGEFCVMNVAHTVTPSNWTTQLTTRFRPTYENEE